jgi:hypothetical protein
MRNFHPDKRLAAAALLLWPFGLSQAQEESPGIGSICQGERLEFPLPPMDIFDVDDDRLISDGEASECESLAELFSRLDLDASSTLTMEEYESFPYLWRRYGRTFEDVE